MSRVSAFRELEQLRLRIARIGGTPFMREMSERLAWEARQQAEIGFRRGIDPYDQPWEPLKYRSGKPLVDEGRLERVITGPAIVTSRGFIITTRGATGFPSVRNAATHQYGKTIRARTAPYMRFRVGGTSRTNGRNWARAKVVYVPRRQFMPEDRLGPRWRAAFERAADEVMARALNVRSFGTFAGR